MAKIVKRILPVRYIRGLPSPPSKFDYLSGDLTHGKKEQDNKEKGVNNCTNLDQDYFEIKSTNRLTLDRSIVRLKKLPGKFILLTYGFRSKGRSSF